MQTSSDPIQPPPRIGPFEIIGEIGRGGMGVVYRARDPRLEREVALKTLPVEIAQDADRLQRLRREARMLASLNHPNIGSIYSLEEDSAGGFFLVLELVEGEGLRDRLQRGAIAVPEVMRISGQIAGALEAAHNRGVIHRDLKPDNIRFTQEGLVKVLDFGLAFREVAPSPDGSTVLLGDGATVLGVGSEVQGSPGYMSPEQARGLPQDRRTDIFSFGCVLYECLAGQPAYSGASWMDRIAAVLTREPVWSALPSSVPAALGELLRLCLRNDPADRPGSMTEIRRALESVTDERTVLLPAAAISAAIPAAPGNLPRQLSRFVGRKREVAEVRRLLEEASLLTVTGVGGGGKTRLALRVAEESGSMFPDGCWLAELGPLTDPGQVSPAVAHALGLREEAGRALIDTIAAMIQTKSMLLILDNCEHLLDATGLLTERLLRSCPRLKILVTSREPLGVAGEIIWRVPSLSTASADEKRLSDAVELFFDRARAAVPAFKLEEALVGTIERICVRLDGIPLAIELAASRVRLLSVEQILMKLDDRFRFLTGGSRTALERHQTLRAAIDWSYGLLSDEEKRLLRRYAVFSGGWSLEAACALSAPEADEFVVLDGLAHLVDKSLVVLDEAGGAARYRMLETVRQFAGEELDRSDEAMPARNLHLGFFVRLAEDGEAGLKGAGQKTWLERMEREEENLLTALHWAQTARERTEAGLRLASSMTGFWQAHGHFTLGRAALEEALALPGADAHPALRAKVVGGIGSLAAAQGDWRGSRRFLDESLAYWRETGNRAGIARAQSVLGMVALRLGEVAQAQELLDESLALARTEDDPAALATVLNNAGTLAMSRRDDARARERFEEAAEVLRPLGNRLHLAVILGNLGLVAQRLGDHAASDRYYQESLALHRELQNRPGAAGTLTLLGHAAWSRGDLPGARSHWSEAVACYREIGSRRGVADLLNNLGLLALEEMDLAAAEPLFKESLSVQRELGSPPREALLLANLGLTYHRRHQPADAADCYRRSLEIRRDTGDLSETIGLLEGTAALAAERGDAVPAARWIGVSERMRSELSRPLQERERARIEETRKRILDQLGEENLRANLEAGRHLTPLAAVEEAIRWLGGAPEPTTDSTSQGSP